MSDEHDRRDGPRASDATVRRARPADRSRLRAVQTATLSDPSPDLLTTALAGQGPPLVIVAETDRPVGYALAFTAGPVAYLAELAVAPADQGQGHGTRLVTALLDRFLDESVERVRLTARADDQRARQFYERLGFAVVDTAPGHYDDADGVVLAREP